MSAYPESYRDNAAKSGKEKNFERSFLAMKYGLLLTEEDFTKSWLNICIICLKIKRKQLNISSF